MKIKHIVLICSGFLPLLYSGLVSAVEGVHITRFEGTTKDNAGPYISKTYPITIETEYNEKRFYYAEQGYFEHPTKDDEIYYTGIQPQGDGTARVLFSLFGGNGARILDTKNCRGGADDLPIGGVTCANVIIPFAAGVTYNFTVSLIQHTDKENSWKGVVEDTSTGEVTQIGSWATPASLGYFTGRTVGFVEDYSDITNCSEDPPTTVVFGGPVSYTENSQVAYKTILGKAEYSKVNGICENKIKFTSTQLPDGGLRIEQQQGVD